MLKKITPFLLLACVLSMTACVSSKKYKAATASAQASKMSYDSLLKKSTDQQTQLDNAISSNKMLTEERDRYQKETDSASGKLKTLQSAVDDYTGSVSDLQKKTADKLADYANRGVEVSTKRWCGGM